MPWVSMAFLIGFVIEAMLAARLWLQMTEAKASGAWGWLLSITDLLVAPFRSDQSPVLAGRAHGVFEISTLVAFEAYLIGILALVLVVVTARFTVFLITVAGRAKRRHDLRKRSAVNVARVEKTQDLEGNNVEAISPVPSLENAEGAR